MYIVCWAGLPSAVMSPSILGKGVETSSAAAQLGLACAQTMLRLPGVYLRQAELWQTNIIITKKIESSVFFNRK